jgi:DNA adenine methylase
MKSIIRWVGGKQSISNIILKYFPIKESVRIYYEPFFGAGTLFFSSKYSRAFLSDSNEQLINFYENLKSNPEKLYRLFINMSQKMDAEYYYLIREESGTDCQNAKIY